MLYYIWFQLDKGHFPSLHTHYTKFLGLGQQGFCQWSVKREQVRCELRIPHVLSAGPPPQPVFNCFRFNHWKTLFRSMAFVSGIERPKQLIGYIRARTWLIQVLISKSMFATPLSGVGEVRSGGRGSNGSGACKGSWTLLSSCRSCRIFSIIHGCIGSPSISK